MAVSLFIPAVDEAHAYDLLTTYQMVTDEVALIMLDQGVIGRTREDADRFLSVLREAGTPGAGDAQVFEISVNVPEGVDPTL